MGVQMGAPMHYVDDGGMHHACVTIKDYPEDFYSHYDLRQFATSAVDADLFRNNVPLDNAEFVNGSCHNMEVCPLVVSQ